MSWGFRPQGMWNVSSPSRDQACSPCMERRSLTPLGRQGSVHVIVFKGVLFIHWLLAVLGHCWRLRAFLQLQRAGATLELCYVGFSLRGFLLLGTLKSRVRGLQYLGWVGSVVPRHVYSSWTRDGTHVPCLGGWSLNHRTARNVPILVSVQFSRSVVVCSRPGLPGYHQVPEFTQTCDVHSCLDVLFLSPNWEGFVA